MGSRQNVTFEIDRIQQLDIRTLRSGFGHNVINAGSIGPLQGLIPSCRNQVYRSRQKHCFVATRMARIVDHDRRCNRDDGTSRPCARHVKRQSKSIPHCRRRSEPGSERGSIPAGLVPVWMLPRSHFRHSAQPDARGPTTGYQQSVARPAGTARDGHCRWPRRRPR